MNKPINRKYLIGILLGLSFILYARTLNYGFVWDDERIHLSNNQQLIKGDLKSFWLKPYSGMYIPVTYSTWSLINAISNPNKKISPKIFHALNAVTHSINCILVFYLLFILFKNQAYAFWGSLLFLLHPLQVESVAWISEFRGLYSAFFSLLSLISIFRYLEKNPFITGRSFITSKYFAFASVMFVLALLSKPSAVVLPFVISVLVWCFYKDKFNPLLKSLSLWLLLVIPILLITRNSQPSELIYDSISFWQRFLIAGYSLFFYLCKLIVPYPLAACYGYTPELILSNKFIYLSTVFSIAIVLIIFAKRKSQPLLFSGFAIITVCVLPVLGLIPFEYQKHSTVADRYIYFGMLGIALLVPLIANIIKKYSWLTYIFGSMIGIYLVLNIKQTNTWVNEFSIWDHTVKHYQNSAKVYYNRGVEYSKLKKFNEAINDYTQCLTLQNDYRDALFNRANAYENIKNNTAAFNDYTAYLLIDSVDGSVYFKRAYLNYKTGNIQGALRDAEKAEKLDFHVGVKFKKMLQERSTQKL
ncbi:MAG: tetratricopeptide repeat protein [Bacteroidetes bacterium]|nr:tetratricopeptide repeat protein [Bacteroidota bacterium]